jgi:hypothetical protein
MKQIAKKLIAAWSLMEPMPRLGTNERYGYSYVREQDAADVVRKAFVKVGLCCIPSVESIERHMESGKAVHTIATVKFTLVDPESGEICELKMVGEGADQYDKSLYKAITGATKYAYLKLAMAGSDDDAEADLSASVPKPEKAPAAPKPEKAPAAPKPEKQYVTGTIVRVAPAIGDRMATLAIRDRMNGNGVTVYFMQKELLSDAMRYMRDKHVVEVTLDCTCTPVVATALTPIRSTDIGEGG